MDHRDKKQTEFEVSVAKRYLSARAQRLIGVPHLDFGNIPLQYDGMHLNACPNSRKVSVFSRPLNKRITMYVPCGHCLYCSHHKQNQLIYRMYNHNKVYKHCLFVTLTYNDDYLTTDPVELRKRITDFIKRFRKELHDPTMSYYMVCEKGDLRDRPHYHMLIWWNSDLAPIDVMSIVRSKWRLPAILKDLPDFYKNVDRITSRLTPVFMSCGFVYDETPDEKDTAVMAYVSKYVSDKTKKILFRSWSHGLGLDIIAEDNHLLTMMRNLGIISYIPSDKEYKLSLSPYYKSKVFTVAERDCFFMDYLVSDSFKDCTVMLDDPQLRHNLQDVYDAYEKRCLDAYRLRCQMKAKKKRLL